MGRKTKRSPPPKKMYNVIYLVIPVRNKNVPIVRGDGGLERVQLLECPWMWHFNHFHCHCLAGSSFCTAEWTRLYMHSALYWIREFAACTTQTDTHKKKMFLFQNIQCGLPANQLWRTVSLYIALNHAEQAYLLHWFKFKHEISVKEKERSWTHSNLRWWHYTHMTVTEHP